MAMPKIVTKQILEADSMEVREYAQTFLGLEIEDTDGDQAVFAKILAATNQTEDDVTEGKVFIMQMEEPEENDQTGAPPPRVAGVTEPVAPSQAMAGSLGKDDPQVGVLINVGERNGEPDKRDVAVAVNGRAWLLRRGVEIKIPYRVYLALKNAVTDSVSHDAATHEEIHSEVPRFAFNAQLPPAAEIAAWHARIDALELP